MTYRLKCWAQAPLQLLDCLSTWVAVGHMGAQEGNPLAVWLIGLGWGWFFAFKALAGLAISNFGWRCRGSKTARVLVTAAFWMYVVVVTWNITGIGHALASR